MERIKDTELTGSGESWDIGSQEGLVPVFDA